MTVKIAFLSDIHGNSPALRAVLENIQRQQCKTVFMLGDLINGIDPHGCVQLLRMWAEEKRVDLACIKGNAEAYLTTPHRNLLPKQDEEWNVDMIQLTQGWEDHLSASDLEWVHSFPDTLHWQDAFLVHDSPMDRIAVESQSDPEILPQYREWFFHGRGLLPDTDEETWQKTLEYMEQNHFAKLFCGHTHIPFQKTINGKLICNIGSAGMPLDGDYRPSWVLVENDANGKETISIRRVDYDVSLTHALIDSTPDYHNFKMPGFCEAYKQWIATGRHWREHMGQQ
jgi:predicted phosphodiesterase